VNFTLELLQPGPFRYRQIRLRATVGLTVLDQPVAARFRANALRGGTVLDRFGGVDHLAAQLVFELLGKFSP
jgi:hypothetical protein